MNEYKEVFEAPKPVWPRIGVFVYTPGLLLLPFFLSNRSVGILVGLILIGLIAKSKQLARITVTKILISTMALLYLFWIYFTLSGFIMRKYFAIKELVTTIQQTANLYSLEMG